MDLYWKAVYEKGKDLKCVEILRLVFGKIDLDLDTSQY